MNLGIQFQRLTAFYKTHNHHPHPHTDVRLASDHVPFDWTFEPLPTPEQCRISSFWYNLPIKVVNKHKDKT